MTETEKELRAALKACLADLESAITTMADCGLVPRSINYKNREKWAELVKTKENSNGQG